MKYQIYLNKETSDFINNASEQANKKPATTIKELIESLVKITIASKEATEKELRKYGKQ